MAHHVAELIDQADRTRGKARAAAEDRCRTAILELWSYRRSLDGRRPTDELEPILDMLQMMKPNDDGSYYYRRAWEKQGEASSEESEETKRWLALARNADESARELVGWALGNAAAHAVDQSLEWIELARKAGAGEDTLLRITLRLQSLRPEFGADQEEPENPFARRLARLKTIRKALIQLEKELQTSLEEGREQSTLPTPPPSSAAKKGKSKR